MLAQSGISVIMVEVFIIISDMELRGILMAAMTVMTIISLAPLESSAYRINDTSPFCQSLKGKSLVSDDWKFLGKFGDQFDSSSIFNQFWTYGSQFNSSSIFNQFWTYGSQFNTLSPWNKFSSKWPLIKDDTAIYWRLTINKFASNAIDPFVALSCFMEPRDVRLEPFLKLNESTSSTWTTPDSVFTLPSPASNIADNYCGLYSKSTGTNGDCKCIPWYQWKNPNDPKDFDCVPKISADALCVSKYWSHAKSDGTWIATDGSYSCLCVAGYSWNGSGTACVLNKTPDQSCKESFGQHSKSSGGNNCSCEGGYEWNGSRTACMSSKTPDQVCQMSFWRFSKYDGTLSADGRYNCACISGYVWDSNMTSCIKTDFNDVCKASYWKNARGDGIGWCLCNDGYVSTSNNSYCVTAYDKGRWNKKFVQLKLASNKLSLNERIRFFQSTVSNLKKVLADTKTSYSARQALMETSALIELELEKLKGAQTK